MLHEVVIGPRIQAGHDIELLVACGENENREVGPSLAQSAADLDPVDIWQAQIEDDEPDILTGSRRRLAAEREPPDRITLAAQDANETGRDRVVIFNQQDAAR